MKAFLLAILAAVVVARPAHDKLTAVLYQLNEEQLSILEGSSWEEMQGDSPSPGNETKSIKERDKEQRIKNIREQVLRYLGRKDVKNSPQPTEQQSMILHVIQHQMNVSQWNSDFYTELQSVYPSCELPRNTDEELWDKGHQMNLYFNLTFPNPGQGSTFSIQWAKLRLYKLPQGNTTMPLVEDCAPGRGDITDKKHYIHFPTPGAQLPIEEKQLRVSVYWYTKALRKHRVKRKLLDSQMISYYGEAWTEWNVKVAVKAWKELGKNFGISVEVEDEDRVILPASKIFMSMNCSKEANIQQPIPSTLVDNLDNNTQQFIKPFSQIYPVIELSTREFPEAEVQYSGIKLTGEHRLRHHHGHNSEIAVNETSGGIKWEDPRDTDTDR
ncbi:uncharacterized protein [Halyomorpha halys]|uniref:uncharacterized protein isoform X2 n=1 Tax=Halyomorpha halys TaxID=286706 RepID=UPI0034D33834